MSEKFDLALIIPCFNEEKRLPKTLESLRDFLVRQSSDKAVVLVFVDDGSMDKTKEVLEVFQKNNSENVHLVCHEKNLGKGAAVVSGARAVEAEIYGFTDADLSFGLEAVPLFLEKLSKVGVVIAVRKNEVETQYSFFRKMISKSFLFLSRRLTGVRATDPQSGFKFFSAKVVKDIFPKLNQGRFSFDTECLLRIEQAGYKVVEVTLSFSHNNQSSVKAADGVRYFLDLFAIMDNLPFIFRRFVFQLVGLSLSLSFAVYGWVIWSGYFFSDDFTWLWFGQRVLADPGQIIALKAGSFFSPVMNIFYAVMFSVFGPSAPAFFTVNILIHAGVAVGAGIFTWFFSRSRLAAFLTVIFVAVSGGAYEPLVWIGANLHSLATLFIIFAIVAYAGFLKNECKSLILVSLVLQFLAYSTKEISIVVPAFLIAVIFSWKQIYKKFPKTWWHLFFWILSGLLAGAYAILQIVLQEGGQTFTKNNYLISFAGFLRLPFAIIDLFVPLRPFQDLLSPHRAEVLLFLIVILMILIVRKYWRLPGLPMFLFLAVVSLLPTTFFATINWWEPLASRYTYLPRIGAVSGLAIILSYYIVHNRARRVISLAAVVIVVVATFQISFMLKTVAADYDYVYRSGRSLAVAAKLLDQQNTEAVYVQPERPFSDNHSHVIGAMAIYAGLSKDQVIFLETDETAQLSSEKMLLYWYPKARQYELTSSQDIFEKFPLP